jgi:acetylornithine deacetylase
MTAPIPDIDRAVRARADDARRLLEALVAAPSTAGAEQEAQIVLAEALEQLGFVTERAPIPPSIAEDPVAGIPAGAYGDRGNLLAVRGDGARPHVLINGHIDVVPAGEPQLWTTPPFAPQVRDGWLFGRGAGDMKGGFAMAWLAIAGLDEARPGWQQGRLSVLAVLEEECTGNGTLAAARAGILADCVVLPEPTDLQLLLGGVGILWFEVEIRGLSSHAEAADRAVNPIDVGLEIVEGLREWEAELNTALEDPLLAHVAHPYNLNVGTFHAGDWPSSVPALARIGFRVGFPRAWSPDEAEIRVRGVVEAIAAGHAWLRKHPPVVRLTGFRASGYALPQEAPLARALAASHADVLGEEPESVVLGTTTDARLYLNEFGIPAVCYGPRAVRIHGIDEAVELASIVDGARVLAAFLGRYLGSGRDGSPADAFQSRPAPIGTTL